VVLVALGAEASIEALYSQALYGEYDAAVMGPMFSTMLDSYAHTAPWSSFVFDLLSVADVPQLAWLAAERPLRIELSTPTWLGYHGWMYERLASRATLEPPAGIADAIRWAVSAAE
jgi:hypothetical protein